jgi:peptide/nickel transport system substrate-binding protein
MFRSLAVASIVALLLSGAMSAESRPRYGGTLRVQTRADWNSDSNPLRNLVYENLTVLDDTGKPQPLLAASWESQSDGRRWQFVIRKGIRFHEGSPLTPTAVVDSLTANNCEDCQWRSIRAIGDAVVVEFNDPRPLFAAELALPRYAIQKVNLDIPSGTGPFRLVERRGNAVFLQAVDDYRLGRPFIDTIEVADSRSDRDVAIDVDLGRADISEISPDQIRRLEQQRRRTLSSQASELIYVRIRTLNPKLDDVRLRQALALSIDRAPIQNVVFQKQGEIAAGLLPNWLTGYSFLFNSRRDLARSQQLLREMGGAPILTIAADDPITQLIAERIALNAREAGITIQAAPVKERADIYVRRLTLGSNSAPVDLLQVADSFSATPDSTDIDNPQHRYEQERNLLSQYLLVPLVYLPRSYTASSRVKNLSITSTGRLSLADAWLEATKQ